MYLIRVLFTVLIFYCPAANAQLTQTLVQNGLLTSGGTDTITGVNFGTASSDRVLVIITTSGPGSGTITSVTCAGITGSYSLFSVGGGELGAISCAIPIGTSGTVVANGASSIGGWQLLGGWSITGGAKSVIDVINADISGANSFNFNISANGVVVGAAFDFASGVTTPSFTSGLTNNGTVFTANSGTNSVIAGSTASTTAQTLTLSSSGAVFPGFVAASISTVSRTKKTLTGIGN